MLSLLHFAVKGHPVIAILGGATGRIGDPSGRNTAKDRLGDSAIERNLAGIQRQLYAFFPKALTWACKANPRLSPEAFGSVTVLDNHEWYRGMGVLEFLDRVGSKMRVASLVSRDSVRSRVESENGLSFSELSYQLLQAYDFAHLHANHNSQLQIGGSDQWGNIVSGLDLIHRLDSGVPAHGLTTPLLVTSSGEKMGKSSGNAKWLDPSLTAPFDLYQYFAGLSDADAEKIVPILSLRPMEELRGTIGEHQARPDERILQRALSFDSVALVHSELDAERSQRASDILFGQAKSGQIEECLEQLASALSGSSLVHELAAKECVGVRLVDVLANVLYRDQSKNHFRALLKSGAVEINGRRITDPLYVMRPHDFRAGKSLVKSGKQAFCMLSLSPQEAACHAAAA